MEIAQDAVGDSEAAVRRLLGDVMRRLFCLALNVHCGINNPDGFVFPIPEMLQRG